MDKIDGLRERLKRPCVEWTCTDRDSMCREASAALAQLQGEVERLRQWIETDAVRFEHCANMIAESHAISGNLRAERTIKARHFALDARAALQPKDQSNG